jgi:hypothetical protein
VSPGPLSVPLGPFLFFPAINLRLFGYFLPVSTTPEKNVIAGVVVTDDEFVGGVISSVLLTPLINIHSRLSLRIFEKSRNDPNGILRGPGDTDS